MMADIDNLSCIQGSAKAGSSYTVQWCGSLELVATAVGDVVHNKAPIVR
jgi:hypothetical protein